MGPLWGQGGQARSQKRDKRGLKRGIPKRTLQKKHLGPSSRRYFEIPSIKNVRFSKSSRTPFWSPFGSLFRPLLAPEGSQGVPKTSTHLQKELPESILILAPIFDPKRHPRRFFFLASISFQQQQGSMPVELTNALASLSLSRLVLTPESSCPSPWREGPR